MQTIKKLTKCNELNCLKNVDMVTAISTGLCEGCKKVFCYQHKFKHTCQELLELQQKKRNELASQLLLAKNQKKASTFFS